MSEMKINEFGDKYWFNPEGKLHREDGPAVEYVSGDNIWYRDGKRHREGCPAVEYLDGTNFWYHDGKRHRINGPAVEYADGYKEYWYSGKYYPEIKNDAEWDRIMKLVVFR